jgi:hypothetical protein
MKTKILLFVTCFSLVFFNSCSKKEGESEFKNQITLGTGLNYSNYFELTGVSSDFYLVNGSVIIYFKVESKQDIAGNAIMLEFRNLQNEVIHTISRPSTQDYGHMLLSSFEWTQSVGTYLIKAYIVKEDSTDFVAETTITIH